VTVVVVSYYLYNRFGKNIFTPSYMKINFQSLSKLVKKKPLQAKFNTTIIIYIITIASIRHEKWLPSKVKVSFKLLA